MPPCACHQVLLAGEDKPAPTPEPAPTPGTPARRPCNYRVKAGDSLFDIGQVRPACANCGACRAWVV